MKKEDREQRARSSITIQLPPQVDALEFRDTVDSVAGIMARGDHVLLFHAPKDFAETEVGRAMEQFAAAVRRGRPVITVEVPAGMDPQVARTRVTAALPGR